MKKTIQYFFISISLLIFSKGFSQTWERSFGNIGRWETFTGLTESYDHGYLILSAFNYYPNTRGWLIKTDINGNPLYDISIGMGTGLSQGNYPAHIEPTTDGGFIICGSHERWTMNDIGVTKHNACGDLEWCKIIRTDGNPDWGRKILQLPDGGYVMLTHQYMFNTADVNINLFRFNQQGQILWVEPYVTPATHPLLTNTAAYDLLINAQGNYFMSGSCYRCDDNTGWSICRLKAMSLLADSSRTELWVSSFKDTIQDEYSSGRTSSIKDSNYYFGASYRLNSTFPVMLLIVDSNGMYIHDSLPQIPQIDNKWAEGALFDPKPVSYGNIIAHSLMVDSSNYYPGWFSLHKLDSLGGWEETFLHPSAHYGARTFLNSDEKIIVGAEIGSGFNQDIILMKFNTNLEYDSIYTAPREYDYLCPDPIVSKTIDLSSCEVIVDVKDIPTRKEYEARVSLIPITPAPNPAGDYVRFLLENTEYHSKIRVVCYDIQGRQLAELPVNSGIHEAGLDVSRWRPGMYMAVVYAGNKQMGKARFVVE